MSHSVRKKRVRKKISKKIERERRGVMSNARKKKKGDGILRTLFKGGA